MEETHLLCVSCLFRREVSDFNGGGIQAAALVSRGKRVPADLIFLKLTTEVENTWQR